MSARVIGTHGTRAIVECPCGVLLGVPAYERRDAPRVHVCPGCTRVFKLWRPISRGSHGFALLDVRHGVRRVR